MNWSSLPADIEALILQEIALMRGHRLKREKTLQKCVPILNFEYSPDPRYNNLCDEPEDNCDACEDVKNCLLVCKSWNVVLKRLLCIYGPVELIISKGCERMAMRAITSWLAESARCAANEKYDIFVPWLIGGEDLLARTIKRGFTDCMMHLLDQVPRACYPALWEDEDLSWCSQCYPFFAVASGKVKTLRILHEHYGMAMEGSDDYNESALSLAISMNQVEIADYLLNVSSFTMAESDINGPLDSVFSPLQHAAAFGTLEMVELMVRRDLHKQDRMLEWSAIALSLERDNTDYRQYIDISSLLLKHAHSAILERGLLMLNLAIESYAPFHIVCTLIELGANIGRERISDDDYPLDTALIRGDVPSIEFLIDRGAKCSTRAVDQALKYEDLALAATLASCCIEIYIGTDVSRWPLDILRTALRSEAKLRPAGADGIARLLSDAVERGDIDRCRLLLEEGADPNKKVESRKRPLRKAIESGNLELLRVFITCGARIEVQDNDLLLEAVSKGNLGLIDILLDLGADINNPEKPTPLSTVLSSANFSLTGKLQLARFLIERGANINARKHKGRTCLHDAIYEGNENIVQFLLHMGADVNSPGPQDATPLLVATSLNSIKIMQLLLKNGAMADMMNSFGDRPLTIAILHCDPETVSLLLEHGAHPAKQDGEYRSPLEIAKRSTLRQGIIRICELIREHLQKRGLPIL